jgi:NAD(P)-dependent dehydrogenase (short-subunit alcohol dehydrogenase family)
MRHPTREAFACLYLLCVVTGAARSLGLAIAERYAAGGAVVDITDREAVLACFADLVQRRGAGAAVQGRGSGLGVDPGLVARVGRASRLGERSRGAIDVGAASCALILRTLADSLRRLQE